MDLHPELVWRPLAASDAEPFVRLVTAVEAADRQPFRTSLAEVVESLAEPWRDLARDTLVGLDAEGTPRASMVLSLPPGDTTERRVFLDGGVDPAWRGRGVGRGLVAWALRRAGELLADVPDGVPWRVGAFLARDDEAGARLLARAGLEPLRWYASLRRDLAAPLPGAPVPDGLVVEGWSPDVDEAVRLVHNAAFADHWGSQPLTAQAWAGGRATFAPAWSLVARDTTAPDHPVVGYLLADRFEEDWAAQGFTSGHVARLGVVREARGRGVATALLAETLRRVAADGLEHVTLGVDTANPSGAHRLYAALGFETFHEEVHHAVTSRTTTLARLAPR